MTLKNIYKFLGGEIRIYAKDILEVCCDDENEMVSNVMCAGCEFESQKHDCRRCTNRETCQECSHYETCEGPIDKCVNKLHFVGYATDIPVKFIDCTIEKITSENERIRAGYFRHFISIYLSEVI